MALKTPAAGPIKGRAGRLKPAVLADGMGGQFTWSFRWVFPDSGLAVIIAIMRRSKVEIYLHIVWATAHRKPFLTPEIERPVHRCIQNEAQQLGCVVLALNGMPDHIHLVAQIPATITIAKLVQQLKGVSSTFARKHLTSEECFQWQENYAAFSVSRSHLKRVITYVQQQKQHHALGNVWPEWEETSEAVEL